jgi:hypothetical protein
VAVKESPDNIAAPYSNELRVSAALAAAETRLDCQSACNFGSDAISMMLPSFKPRRSIWPEEDQFLLCRTSGA